MMSDKIRLAVVYGTIVCTVACIVGATINFVLGNPEAGASLIGASVGCGFVTVVAATFTRNGGPPPAVLACAFGGVLAATTAGCGTLCTVYDSAHETACALCEVADGEDCQGPACVTCRATSAECPFAREAGNE